MFFRQATAAQIQHAVLNYTGFYLNVLSVYRSLLGVSCAAAGQQVPTPEGPHPQSYIAEHALLLHPANGGGSGGRLLLIPSHGGGHIRLSHRPDAGLLQLEAPPGARHPRSGIELQTSSPQLPMQSSYSTRPGGAADFLCLLVRQDVSRIEPFPA